MSELSPLRLELSKSKYVSDLSVTEVGIRTVAFKTIKVALAAEFSCESNSN